MKDRVGRTRERTPSRSRKDSTTITIEGKSLVCSRHVDGGKIIRLIRQKEKEKTDLGRASKILKKK